MAEIDPTKIDPRLIHLAASRPQPAMNQGGVMIPGRGPVNMPMAMPGPQGGMNRYREMTLEEMLLENRVIFLVGEINHISAARTYMQMLYLQSVKRDQEIHLYINSPGGVVDDTLARSEERRVGKECGCG